MLLKHMMKENIDYFIEKVNAPLARAIIILGGRYEEPTHGNVVHPNSHLLLDIRDEFFKCWNLNSFSERLCKVLFRMVIVKYEHSPNWRNLFDWFLMMVQRSDWKPFNPNRQMSLWRMVKCR